MQAKINYLSLSRLLFDMGRESPGILHDQTFAGCSGPPWMPRELMAEIATNRDFYCFIAELVEQRKESGVALESYLENLRRLARACCDQASLPLSAFARLLQEAFEPATPERAARSAQASGYRDWEQRIADQIRDLREMKQEGILEDEYRYFGVDAPSGARWYNFDPCTYLECAAAGTVGGWQDGDGTGRVYVSGQVAVIDSTGALTSMDPRDIEEPVVDLPEITWQMFSDFLEAGQCYE